MITLILNAIFVACLLLGVAVALGSMSKRSTKTLFLLLCGCLMVWAASIQWFLGATDFQQQVTAAKIFYFVSALFSPTLFLFAIYFPKEDEASLRRYLPFVVAVTAAMLVWITLSDQFILSSVSTVDGNSMFRVDQFQYATFTIFFMPFFVAAMITNIYKFSVYRGVERSQAIWYTVGIGLTSIPGFYGNLILPYFGVYEFIWLGPVAIVFFLITTFYSIIRHSLFDIRLVVVRSLAYVLALITMASIYVGLAYGVSVIFLREDTTTGLSLSPVNVAMALLLAFIFQPIKQFFDRTTNQFFYRDSYDTNNFIARLGRVLTSTTQLHDVLERAAHEIQTTLKSGGSMFLVYREDQPAVVVQAGMRNHFDAAEHEVLRQWAMPAANKVVTAVSLHNSQLQHERDLSALFFKYNIALMLPLRGSKSAIGFLMLGEQLGGGYKKRDIAVLETIADELVIAIQNARSVQAIQDLNANLKHGISEATRELRSSNKRLKELDKTKDEFISMASHQLRTPLTSVKGYISMVLEGDAGKVTPTQKKLLGEAFASSERMVHLIGDFLNVSRLQTGKFILERHESDLGELVQQEVDGMSQIAKMHGIDLRYRKPKVFPVLYLDEGKLRQVIMNFIDNAIYYSPDSDVITVAASVEEGAVVVKVTDKGMGVPKAAQEKLFTKFFRAENARRQRPDGTGVGLFLAKKVVDEHGGSILFESREGKGSTFGFRLPIKKLSLAPADDLNNL